MAVLDPVLLPKVWGGDALRAWHLPVAPGARVGEAWMVADLRETAASGAGGGAVQSPLHGAPGTLGTLLNAAPRHWLGAGAAAAPEGFPLLVKLLDAREHLSVQVHPSPGAVAPGERVKHECWLVLEAAPGAQLFLGLQDGIDRRALAEATARGTLPTLLRAVPAVVGECHLLPSGLVHALGAGCVVAEVQTASDTTFRLYDWTREYGRPERAMHVERALAACEPALRAVTQRFPDAGIGPLATTGAFRCEGVVLQGEVQCVGGARPGGPLVVLPVEGRVQVGVDGESVDVPTGAAAVIAADRAGPVELRGVRARVVVAEARPSLA